MPRDERPTRNPYVFVVGCPRSGTTLLQRMLDSHPLLAVSNDSHFIPRAVEDVPHGVDPELTPELVEWVRTYRRFYRLELSDETVDRAAASARTYAEFVTALYSAYAAQRGKVAAGEKTPDYVRCLPRLHDLFPWARSVHIIRDGRDVVLSTVEWAVGGKGPSKLALWEQEPVAVAALWWRWQVRTGRKDSASLPAGRYREVRYEDLVTSPEETLSGVAGFLDLPDSPDMAAFHEGKTRSKPGLSAKQAWLPATTGLRQWQEHMPERERALVESLAGDLLEELGYELSVETVPDEVQAVAEKCRAWWQTELKRP